MSNQSPHSNNVSGDIVNTEAEQEDHYDERQDNNTCDYHITILLIRFNKGYNQFGEHPRTFQVQETFQQNEQDCIYHRLVSNLSPHIGQNLISNVAYE